MFGLEQEDLDFYIEIMAHGLTIDEFIKLKDASSLPKDLLKAWNNYQEWLNNLEE